MHSEQDPCGCCEQADIDPREIQVLEAASAQPFNFEGLSNLTRSTEAPSRYQGFLLEFHRSNGNGTCLRCLETLDVLQDFCKRAIYDV